MIPVIFERLWPNLLLSMVIRVWPYISNSKFCVLGSCFKKIVCEYRNYRILYCYSCNFNMFCPEPRPHILMINWNILAFPNVPTWEHTLPSIRAFNTKCESWHTLHSDSDYNTALASEEGGPVGDGKLWKGEAGGDLPLWGENWKSQSSMSLSSNMAILENDIMIS